MSEFISSQFVMTSRMKRPKKSLPYAFTELGALMLSSVPRRPIGFIQPKDEEDS
ncbi:ORF6N domain-containing protein [Prevotella sp. E2-28]|uniref:ORF6N domain-containing protein n=1 Tax=Prevotella sp. E2-28 TaxID=2913620 RepID=UPI001ED9C9DE|nr:ORF6N domain-containing protein [Prevotella sp. E2-28]UKK54234.1 ORF6N domain-containing protein [Prevotella sp. E2-28]